MRKVIYAKTAASFKQTKQAALLGGWVLIGKAIEENGNYSALVELDIRSRTRKALNESK